MSSAVIKTFTALFFVVWTSIGSEAVPAPFFGLDAFDTALSNGTSLFSTLLATHAAHSLSALGQLADLAALGANITTNFIG